MKKIVSLLLCLIAVLSLFSCESNQNQDDLSQNEETAFSDMVESEDTADNTTIQVSEAERAMEMYEAAIKGEICVFDESLDEVKLEDCRFPSNHLRLGECEILSKAILDMDQDGINEYVIQSEAKDHIVLRYYDGKVYSYCFDSNSFYNLNTDGSFYWIEPDESENWSRGLKQLSFDGSSCNIKEIYKISFPCDDYYEHNIFYMDGKQITSAEFSDYYVSNIKTGAIFSPFDLSCEYPISSEKACELASNYWQIENGTGEGAAGTYYIYRIVILEKPNSDTPSYHIGGRMEGYRNHIPDSYYSLPAHRVILHKELLVDAITGECMEENTNPAFDYEE